ncbi:hypothetical protein F183_A54620 (plasmid) [Bryobacterales bacterium F-183]|nr:hypothetical protein F183_A54620 [Bryobacterales bacterium F-183]
MGGSILKANQAAGTYYAAMGLVGHVNELGPHFDLTDLSRLTSDGHELGSHTFDHVSGRAMQPDEFLKNATEGCCRLQEVAGNTAGQHFSYPFGHATLRLKPLLGSKFATCRGIVPGLNASPADLNLLRANSIYSYSFDPAAIEVLLRTAKEKEAWAIFYTHDVADKPSKYGCTPLQLEQVVRMAKKFSLSIRTIGEVVPSSR